MDSEVSPLVAVVGETASGKSAVAVSLAEDFNGELICADSWTVRRHVDIGASKPSQNDQAKIPHHMLDVVEPCQNFTAAVYKDMALQKIDAIHQQGKLPIMVGGTGLYVDSILYDYSFLPEGDPTTRYLLNNMTITQLLERAHAENLDTSIIDIRNKRRIIRLIETKGALPEKKPLRANTLLLGISLDKDVLQQRIIERINTMVEQGLEQEVIGLAQTYGWQCEALKGIGYVEWRPYLEGVCTLDEVKQHIMRSTLMLAKRQRTWFKRNKSIQWCEGIDDCRQKMYAFMQNQRTTRP
ncbi:tRNA (adenosine(37)-N6)-dimethylallyltransferase MiaA [soil metagenome]